MAACSSRWNVYGTDTRGLIRHAADRVRAGTTVTPSDPRSRRSDGECADSRCGRSLAQAAVCACGSAFIDDLEDSSTVHQTAKMLLVVVMLLAIFWISASLAYGLAPTAPTEKSCPVPVVGSGQTQVFDIAGRERLERVALAGRHWTGTPGVARKDHLGVNRRHIGRGRGFAGQPADRRAARRISCSSSETIDQRLANGRRESCRAWGSACRGHRGPDRASSPAF